MQSQQDTQDYSYFKCCGKICENQTHEMLNSDSCLLYQHQNKGKPFFIDINDYKLQFQEFQKNQFSPQNDLSYKNNLIQLKNLLAQVFTVEYQQMVQKQNSLNNLNLNNPQDWQEFQQNYVNYLIYNNETQEIEFDQNQYKKICSQQDSFFQQIDTTLTNLYCNNIKSNESSSDSDSENAKHNPKTLPYMIQPGHFPMGMYPPPPPYFGFGQNPPPFPPQGPGMQHPPMQGQQQMPFPFQPQFMPPNMQMMQQFQQQQQQKPSKQKQKSIKTDKNGVIQLDDKNSEEEIQSNQKVELLHGIDVTKIKNKKISKQQIQTSVNNQKIQQKSQPEDQINYEQKQENQFLEQQQQMQNSNSIIDQEVKQNIKHEDLNSNLTNLSQPQQIVKQHSQSQIKEEKKKNYNSDDWRQILLFYFKNERNMELTMKTFGVSKKNIQRQKNKYLKGQKSTIKNHPSVVKIQQEKEKNKIQNPENQNNSKNDLENKEQNNENQPKKSLLSDDDDDDDANKDNNNEYDTEEISDDSDSSNENEENNTNNQKIDINNKE